MTGQPTITLRGRRFSYRDPGGDGTPVLALHGHFGRGRGYDRLAAALTPTYRVVAPDQRGHGLSDHGGDFHPDAYVEDAAAFLEAMGLAPAAVVGHSMGGVVAYRLAARHPELVSALVVEDVAAVVRQPEIAAPVLDVHGWPVRAASREELGAAIVARGIPDATYFLDSAVPDGDGWRMLLDWDEMMVSQRALVGDWWADWLASSCPTLLLRGDGPPRQLPAGVAADMVRRRPNTSLQEFPNCSHWIHDEDPDGFATAVRVFLDASVRAG